MSGFNWDDLRVFLTVVRSGNAYGAAQSLSIDHTTVRRRIRSLEAALTTKLIDPAGQGWTLTEGGTALFNSLEGIEASIADVSSRVSGADNSAAGRVRVGAPDGFGSVFLAHELASIPSKHPGMVVELLSISRQFNVASREADVAIIISFPPPSRHIIRKLGTVKLRLYTTQDYLEKTGPIKTVEDLNSRDFVGYLEDHPFLPAETVAQPVFSHMRRANFVSNSIIAQFNAVLGGAGIGLFPSYMVRNQPSLRPVLPEEIMVPVDMHLLLHADLRNIARYRIIADFIAEVVDREAKMFD
jgi:DNA-binding transcriptional LysR family regulator